MNSKPFVIRVPRRWAQIALVVAVTAAIVAPLTAWASHSFTDVPDDHTFHADIEWMKDTGITKGCNPPDNTEYCPDDSVTRGQMAAFMHRLGNNLMPRAAFNATDDAPDDATSSTLSTEITAPAPGVLIMSGTVDAANTTDAGIVSCRLLLDGQVVIGTAMAHDYDGPTDVNERVVCPTTGAVQVSAGTHTVDLAVDIEETTTGLGDASVWALWVPFDGTGTAPSS